jgi:hypothetical protein
MDGGSPLVINFGKKSRKAIKQLKRGEGALLDEVDKAIRLARADLGTQAANKTIVPVVLIYKRKDEVTGLAGLRLF